MELSAPARPAVPVSYKARNTIRFCLTDPAVGGGPVALAAANVRRLSGRSEWQPTSTSGSSEELDRFLEFAAPCAVVLLEQEHTQAICNGDIDYR